MKAYRLSVLIITFLLLVSSIVSLSLGWLTNFKDVLPPLDFSAGAPDGFTLTEIRYDYIPETATAVTQIIEENKETFGEGAFDVTDLQFGKITNLSSLEEFNYVYYAIKVPKKNGGNISLGISYTDCDGDGAHYKIYVPTKNADGDVETDANGYIVTELLEDADTLEDIGYIEVDENGNKIGTFITYSFAISENAPSYYADVADMDALFEEDKAEDEKSAEKKEHQMFDDGSGSPVMNDVEYSATADYYYIYVKLTPNIELYSKFIDHLWDNMPFHLAYEVRVKLEVNP